MRDRDGTGNLIGTNKFLVSLRRVAEFDPSTFGTCLSVRVLQTSSTCSTPSLSKVSEMEMAALPGVGRVSGRRAKRILAVRAPSVVVSARTARAMKLIAAAANRKISRIRNFHRTCLHTRCSPVFLVERCLGVGEIAGACALCH
jgi:hypothetical protein